MTEFNIEVDENDNQIGLRPKEDFYTAKYIHRSSHLILFNSKNEILMQKRAPTKKWYPNLYTYSVSGSVENETYEENINKEMQEEIGISIPVKRLFVYPHFDNIDKAFHAIFIGTTDQKITPDNREMTEVKWIDKNELKIDIETNPDIYTPPFVKGMKIFFKEHD